MKGYKATYGDMTCLGFQFEMDKEFIYEGEIKLCESGFHFCTNMFDCFMFYHARGTRLFEVECEEVSDEVEADCSKRVCGRIKFIKEINIDEQNEEFHLNMVKNDVFSIKLIKNPSIKVQLAAVKQYGNAIGNIENPSIKVQLATVTQNGHGIRWINNPSPEVQLAAVTLSGWAIQWIENPSFEVQLAAVNQTGYAISCIKNPSVEVQLAAVTQNSGAFRYIKNPSREVINYYKSKK